jgi:hypothetical protein
MHLSDAANLMAPAYLTILAKGYTVRAEQGLMVAAKGADTFSAEGPVALLGVIVVGEFRGHDWRPTDEEVEDFVARFGYS